jgi:hypothetical protein
MASSSIAREADGKPRSRRPGRDSQESLLLLLDVYEALPQLKQECLDYALIARLLASVRSDITSEKEWAEIYWLLDECERDYEQMVIRFRLDPVLLFAIYQRMLAIRERWLCYWARDLWSNRCSYAGGEGGRETDGMDDKLRLALRERETMWEGLMVKIKKMLVASR